MMSSPDILAKMKQTSCEETHRERLRHRLGSVPPTEGSRSPAPIPTSLRLGPGPLLPPALDDEEGKKRFQVSADKGLGRAASINRHGRSLRNLRDTRIDFGQFESCGKWIKGPFLAILKRPFRCQKAAYFPESKRNVWGERRAALKRAWLELCVLSCSTRFSYFFASCTNHNCT